MACYNGLMVYVLWGMIDLRKLAVNTLDVKYLLHELGRVVYNKHTFKLYTDV